jgi:hypothetical protein
MLRKIGIVGLTVAVALVVFGCSNDAVTPEGQGTADSRYQYKITGKCFKGDPPPGLFEPYEGVHVWCDDAGDYTDEYGTYVLVLDNGTPQWMWIHAQVGNLTPIQSVYYYYPGGQADGPDFYF